MNPEITIKITVSPDEANVSAGGLVLAAEGPPPLSLDQLQSAGFAAAPGPVSPEALQAASVVSEPPPPPMAIDALRAQMVPEAPAPVALGELQGMAAAPMPTLDYLEGAMEAPEPMPLEQLTVGNGEGKGKKR